ncbi:MAG: CHAT domain-containing protein [Cyanothece sp. SIO2G6]|nr:CHAT domain-containing protein [Cyanothece sp. SIO2G6]
MIRRLGILVLSFLLGIGLTLVTSSVQQLGWAQPAPSVPQVVRPELSLEQGRDLYRDGQFADAAQVLRQAVQIYHQQSQVINQALALNYLALSEYRLGNRVGAIAHLTNSQNLLIPLEQSKLQQQVYAQVLTTNGQFLLSQGQAVESIEQWKLAYAIYQTLDDNTGMLGTAINQVQALRSLGRYRLAQTQLDEIQTALANHPDPKIQMVGWRSLGNGLHLVGELAQAQEALEQSLAVARVQQSASDMAAAWLGLGNIERTRGNQRLSMEQPFSYGISRGCPRATDRHAIENYQNALDAYSYSLQFVRNPMDRSRIQLNQLTLQMTMGQHPTTDVIKQLEDQLHQLSPSRFASNAYVNMAHGLICLNQQSEVAIIAEPQIKAWLTTAAAIATDLDDPIAESYALGTIGYLYEQGDHLQQAKHFTQEAIERIQNIQASEVAYQWYWQMGRLLQRELQHQGILLSETGINPDINPDPDSKRPQVLQAYQNAFRLLQSLRQDLAALDTDTQFSFRQTIEPFYRQYADVLLQKPTQVDLAQARQVIESLQLAELDNFFQDACSTAQPELLDRIADIQDPTAAILYPIILGDRIETIAKLPGETTLLRSSVNISRDQVQQMLQQMRQDVKSPRAYNAPDSTQQVYQWIVQPLHGELIAHQTRTLVFVLDGPLQAVPMSTLHTGDHYLIEDFAIALAPGLQLLSPRPLQETPLAALTGGLTESRFGFPELPAVATELEAVEAILPVQTQLLNESFEEEAIASALDNSPSTIVHFATHANFSSEEANTFILLYDKKLGVIDLQTLLQPRDLANSNPIELLVLSACETAQGDQRAALGLAGLAVRAGARSTLATLWKVPDKATAELMSEFYRQLFEEHTENKAIALQQAQLHLLNNTPYKRPLYWAPFVLLGNWL